MQNLSHLPEPLLADDDQLSLAELVNRVLDRGAVINGDVLISVAGVDLLYVGLRVMLSSIESMQARRGGDSAAERSRPEAARPDEPAPVRRGGDSAAERSRPEAACPDEPAPIRRG